MRRVSENVRLITNETAQGMLELGELDLIIAHNVKGLIFVKDYSLPKVAVFYNCLTTEIELAKDKVDRKAYLEQVDFLLKNVDKFFIAEKNEWIRAEW